MFQRASSFKSSAVIVCPAPTRRNDLSTSNSSLKVCPGFKVSILIFSIIKKENSNSAFKLSALSVKKLRGIPGEKLYFFFLKC